MTRCPGGTISLSSTTADNREDGFVLLTVPRAGQQTSTQLPNFFNFIFNFRINEPLQKVGRDSPINCVMETSLRSSVSSSRRDGKWIRRGGGSYGFKGKPLDRFPQRYLKASPRSWQQVLSISFQLGDIRPFANKPLWRFQNVGAKEKKNSCITFHWWISYQFDSNAISVECCSIYAWSRTSLISWMTWTLSWMTKWTAYNVQHINQRFIIPVLIN